MVDEHAGELIADRTLHERRGDSRVNAARETADHQPTADLLLDSSDLLVDHIGHGPVRREPRDVVEEVHQDFLPMRTVPDLRVKLHACHATLGILEGCHGRTGRCGRDDEAVGRHRHAVAVRHPHVRSGGQAGKERTRLGNREFSAAELA